MASQIALFNHKGGVSKTTTCFNLGWMLANKGKQVLLVDCDPQCNLTGMVLGFGGAEEFKVVYEGESPIFPDPMSIYPERGVCKADGLHKPDGTVQKDVL